MSKLSVTFLYLLFLRWSSPSPLVEVQNTTIHDAANEPAEFYIAGGFRPPDTKSLARYVISMREGSTRRVFGDNHHCGGSIIAPGIILTAAHCVAKRRGYVSADDVTVVAGTPHRCIRTVTTQEVGVKAIVPHENYKYSRHPFDIALLRLKGALKIDNKTVSVIPIATKTAAVGTNCTIVGWGRLYRNGPRPEEVVHANVAVAPFDYCKKKYADEHKYVRDGMVCAAQSRYESDVCNGDSGGPLICNGELAGVVSWGQGCPERGYPNVYTDVAYYKDWIWRSCGPHCPWRSCAPHCPLDVRMLLFSLAVNLYYIFKY